MSNFFKISLIWNTLKALIDQNMWNTPAITSLNTLRLDTKLDFSQSWHLPLDWLIGI